MITWLTGRLGRYLWPLLAVAAALLSASLVVQTHRVASAKAATLKVAQQCAADKADAQAQALRQTTAYRAEETRRLVAQQEIADDLAQKLARARADADIADAAAGRLQQRIGALVAAARAAAQHPAAAGAGAPADDAIGLLADVLGRADAAAGELAAIADQRGAAGQACQLAYDSLTAGAAP